MSAPAMKPWPKLSTTLSGPKQLGVCQNCGAEREDVRRWMEHDDDDQPRPVVVCLCQRCSDKLIEPHPRLYRALHEWEPVPGSMELCTGCTHQAGVSCVCPKAQINGGPGLEIVYPKPTVALLYGRRAGGGRFSRQEWLFSGPPTECDGREAST